jgi:hypothetical protein
MSEEEASLLTYDTKRKKFDSVYQRNKFYRGLFGYKQTVKKNSKKYEYEKDGVMDKIPSIRIDDSVFILAREHTERVEDYFSNWGDKVTHHIFTVMIDDPDIIEKLHTKGDIKE